MGPITFSGLASGLDTASIVSQLVALERAPAQALESRKSDFTRHKTIVTDISTALKSVSEVANGLRTANDVRAFAATSSNEDRVGVTSSGSALPGTYAIRVNKLAQAETTASNAFATADAGVVGVGSVTLTVGTDTPVTINYDATHSLADIASMINDSDARASASVLYDGSQYRLMVSSNETGLSSAMTFSETGSVLGLAVPGNELVEAQDSEITLNTLTVTRPSNTLSDVLSGVTLELKETTQLADPDTVVTVERDLEGQREIVQEFVDKFNETTDLVNKQLTYNGVQKGTDTLFGDSTLQSVQRRLSSMATATYTHGASTTSLGEMGISIDVTGKLSIDAAKFDSAVTADPQALESLFAGSGGADGLSQVFIDMVDAYTRTGDGILSAKNAGIDDRIDGIDDQIERIEENALALSERLERQFSALEQLVAELQTQQNFLNSILS